MPGTSLRSKRAPLLLLLPSLLLLSLLPLLDLLWLSIVPSLLEPFVLLQSPLLIWLPL